LPFDEAVEGLSYFGDKSCVVEAKVQTDDFQDSTFFRVVSTTTASIRSNSSPVVVCLPVAICHP